MKSAEDRLKAFKEGLEQPYAWPGGYAHVLLMRDGTYMCHDCAKENAGLIEESITTANVWDTWYPEAWDIYWEGPDEPCCNCYRPIPSEYGDPDAEATADHYPSAWEN